MKKTIQSFSGSFCSNVEKRMFFITLRVNTLWAVLVYFSLFQPINFEIQCWLHHFASG